MENGLTERYFEVVVDVIRAAGERLKGISQRRVNSDAGNDVKLQEDVESELFIREKLSSTNLPVVGEERGGDIDIVKSGELYWVVDPIDGTYNFLRGMPGVCVSIGLMRGMDPVVGAVFDFTRDELFAGGVGLPLTLNGKTVTPRWASDVRQAALMTGFPNATDYSDENLKRFVLGAQTFKKVRMVGSAAVAMAWVACGRADAYREDRLYLWDVAGGMSLMKSAGAFCGVKLLGVEGKPFCVSVEAAGRADFLGR